MPRGFPLVRRAGPWWPPLALLLLALLGCNRGLWTPDEPREAEISREMALAPSVIPTLNGARFIEKPPLYYWTVAALYRLTGGASVAAARSVSVMASLATLALLYIWGSTVHSRAVGALSALMLATSEQFMVSSHWVLIDPLLMLSTTLAAWAAWELLARRDSPALAIGFYGSLVIALWIKGPIGPVLIGAGLLAYVLIDRPLQWRRLRPITGLSVLGLAVLLLGLAIEQQGGAEALWEWAYVNHVQRLLSPGNTGHRQPLLYYAWTLPVAVLPWLLPLLEALRPMHWRRVQVSALRGLCDPARYGALMSTAMLGLLSLSATKRETYLLPVLPLLFLWLGIRTYEWWQHWQLSRDRQLGVLWWLQAAVLCLCALAAPVAALIWRRAPDVRLLAALLAAAIGAGALLYTSARAQRAQAGIAALVCAVVGGAVLLALAPILLNTTKDMGPFVRWLDQQLPAGQPVYATGVDETLEAVIPFYSGRSVVALAPRLLQQPGSLTLPQWLLVQDNHDSKAGDSKAGDSKAGDSKAADPQAGDSHAGQPGAQYVLVGSEAFGPRRSLMLWRRELPAAPP